MPQPSFPVSLPLDSVRTITSWFTSGMPADQFWAVNKAAWTLYGYLSYRLGGDPDAAVIIVGTFPVTEVRIDPDFSLEHVDAMLDLRAAVRGETKPEKVLGDPSNVSLLDWADWFKLVIQILELLRDWLDKEDGVEAAT